VHSAGCYSTIAIEGLRSLSRFAREVLKNYAGERTPSQIAH
jgi:hypothetical protein